MIIEFHLIWVLSLTVNLIEINYLHGAQHWICLWVGLFGLIWRFVQKIKGFEQKIDSKNEFGQKKPI